MGIPPLFERVLLCLFFPLSLSLSLSLSLLKIYVMLQMAWSYTFPAIGLGTLP